MRVIIVTEDLEFGKLNLVIKFHVLIPIPISNNGFRSNCWVTLRILYTRFVSFQRSVSEMDATRSLTAIFIVLAMVSVSPSTQRKHNRIYTVNRWYDLPGYSETPFSDCGSKGSSIQKVEVIPCNNDNACQLKSGSNATFKISFISKVNTTSLRARIHGIVAGIPVPFHCPQVHNCF